MSGKNRNRHPGHVLLVLLAVGSATGCAATPAATWAPSPVEQIEEVWSIVNERFYDANFNGADWNAARLEALAVARRMGDQDETPAIIRRMLAKLNTSHTAYYTADDREYYDLLDIFAAQFTDFIAKRFGPDGVRYEGIGVITRHIDGRWYVVDVLPGGALRLGDEIIAVDGEPYHPIKSFRGRAWDRVSIEIQRTPSPQSRQTVLPLVQWIRPSEAYRLFNSQVLPIGGRSIGYVRVRSYAGEHIHDAIVRTVTGNGPLANAEALVLDLRGGWGGANPGYLDLFHKHVPALTFLPRDSLPIRLDDRWRKPVVLLVDGETRSGKEILAYAFKKHGLGTIVGTRTAGAVVGGSPFLLNDGSLLFLATHDVLVDGERQEGIGVEPDVNVELSIPYLNGADPQLETALRIAAEHVAGER